MSGATLVLFRLPFGFTALRGTRELLLVALVGLIKGLVFRG